MYVHHMVSLTCAYVVVNVLYAVRLTMPATEHPLIHTTATHVFSLVRTTLNFTLLLYSAYIISIEIHNTSESTLLLQINSQFKVSA